MKTWKLVSGILSIVLFALVGLQSCAVGVGDSLSQSGEVSGTTGIIVAFLMLAGGIVSIVTKKDSSKCGNIALIILFGLAALFGFTMSGSYKDLNIWAFWCLICAILALVSYLKSR